MSFVGDHLLERQIQNDRKAHYSAKKTFRALAVAAIALAGILILVATAHPAGMDYIEYWSSGKLLIHHIDPYSPAGIFALEKAHGFLAATPLIMLNPPWALFLVAPLGFVGLRTGLFLWIMADVGCILASAQLLNLSAKNRAFVFVFAPAVACVCSGQGSLFLLLGFSLFLRFNRSRPFLAGASLLLMAIKPHLFLVFWAILLADSLYRRRILILAGGASALAVATAFSMYFDVHIWQHYFAMLRGYKLQQGFLPTASMLLRMVIDVRAFWLLFIPSILAVIWGLWYYARWRHTWDWRTHGMLLMLVTILASPYGFFSDEIVLLPSIVFALTFPATRKYSGEILLVINSIALIIVLAAHAALSSHAYLWTPLAWLVWFLYATHRARRREGSLTQLVGTADGETV
jgi:hypothetical protein